MPWNLVFCVGCSDSVLIPYMINSQTIDKWYWYMNRKVYLFLIQEKGLHVKSERFITGIRSVLSCSLLLGSSAMLAFIIAECGAKVGVIAHRRLIIPPPNHTCTARVHTCTHTHTRTRSLTHTNKHILHVPFGLPLSLSHSRCDPCHKTTALSCID